MVISDGFLKEFQFCHLVIVYRLCDMAGHAGFEPAGSPYNKVTCYRYTNVLCGQVRVGTLCLLAETS